jgi:hypothetical protein
MGTTITMYHKQIAHRGIVASVVEVPLYGHWSAKNHQSKIFAALIL